MYIYCFFIFEKTFIVFGIKTGIYAKLDCARHTHTLFLLSLLFVYYYYYFTTFYYIEREKIYFNLSTPSVAEAQLIIIITDRTN